MGNLQIVHQLLLASETSFLEESFVLHNQGKLPIELTNLRFGFTRGITDADGVIDSEIQEDRFIPIPYRRHPLEHTGEYQDYSISDILFKRGRYTPSRGLCPQMSQSGKINWLPTQSLGAEGWVWTFGHRSLLIIKYCQEHIEFSLMGIEFQSDGIHLCFGGCGRWRENPECLGKISAGAKILCGCNRYQLLDGGFKEGYYAFRSFMDKQGHCVPEDFNPPVVWNELYDNRLWWGKRAEADTPQARKNYYRHQDMEREATKARELECQSLYLVTPGWDTSNASAIWDEKRLGTIESFVNLMKEDYHLSVSLNCPLAVRCDPSAYPREADRMDLNGKRLRFKLCSGAKQYLDVKAERLLKLCQAGAIFLMFDRSGYTGPCFDENHGHPIPYTREAHCRSYLELTRRIHRKFPHLLIEMHDLVAHPFSLRYCPTYYLHGLPGSFDEKWLFEYMWNPMEDLLSGRAISLYYYNLAYSLPIHLHIDLRMDNSHCLEFWWYASTCRHLGVGGKSSDPTIWGAHKTAMQRYLRLKEFYTQGFFYGFGEDLHVHVLPKRQAAVINLFNLTGQEVWRRESFSLEEVGILPDLALTVEDARCNVRGDFFEFARRMPPYSAAVVEIWPRKAR
ncbi:hypothetical protein ES703_99782 [subsurface metagenome]